jgi:YD repeat-containing protein
MMRCSQPNRWLIGVVTCAAVAAWPATQVRAGLCYCGAGDPCTEGGWVQCTPIFGAPCRSSNPTEVTATRAGVSTVIADVSHPLEIFVPRQSLGSQPYSTWTADQWVNHLGLSVSYKYLYTVSCAAPDRPACNTVWEPEWGSCDACEGEETIGSTDAVIIGGVAYPKFEWTQTADTNCTIVIITASVNEALLPGGLGWPRCGQELPYNPATQRNLLSLATFRIVIDTDCDVPGKPDSCTVSCTAFGEQSALTPSAVCNWYTPSCGHASNDPDGDRVLGGCDNCPMASNVYQTDTDGDGIGNACGQPADLDIDSDNNDAANNPARTAREDSIEDDPGLPGKYVVAGSQELVPLVLEIPPRDGFAAGNQQNFKLAFNSGAMRLWESADRNNEILPNVEYAHSVWVRGDLDGDGHLTHADDALLQDYLAGKTVLFTCTGACAGITLRDVADVNGDGLLDESDLAALNSGIDDHKVHTVPLRLWIEGVGVAPGELGLQQITASVDLNDDNQFEGQDTVDVTVSSNTNFCSSLSTGVATYIPVGGSCADVSTTCGNPPRNQAGTPPPERLNLDLSKAFGPGDYPPLSTDPARSSAPMVSKEVQHFEGPSRYPERQTQNGVIDLMTGVPLLQETDFELPFGSATFRHIRTYSESMAYHGAWFTAPGNQKSGNYWDWNGMNWMMSENPILLIDMHHCWQPGRMCYFIPDAHHAIPFSFDGQRFVAPPWMDAILSCNGVPDAAPNSPTGWTTFPTEFYLWMNHRSVQYTFHVHDEDVSPEEEHRAPNYDCLDGVSAIGTCHDGAGWTGVCTSDGECQSSLKGVPYYALLSKIEDRYGNTVEYQYCEDATAYPCDEYRADGWGTSDKPPGCLRCCKRCNEKGRVSSIRLKTNHGTNTVWTLLYTYRRFGRRNEDAQMGDLYGFPMYWQTAVHSIYVYPGDSVQMPPHCLVVTQDKFWNPVDSEGNPKSLDEVDPDGIPAGWVTEAKYMYSDVAPYTGNYGPSLGCVWEPPEPGYLLKARITRKVGSAETKRYRLYRYASDCENPYFLRPCPLSLASVYGDSLVEAVRAGAGSADVEQCLNATMGLGLTTPLPNAGPVQQYAELSFDVDAAGVYSRHGFSSAIQGGASCHNWYDLVTFLDKYSPTPSGKELVVMGGFTKPSFRDSRPGGAHGEYVMYFAHFYPTDWDRKTPWGVPYSSPIFDEHAWPSVVHFPFRAVTARESTGPAYVNLDYNAKFTVVVIDELGKPDEAEHEGADGPIRVEPYSPKQNKGLASRRVVELDPRGFLLSDRKFSYRKDANGTIQQDWVEAYGYTEDVTYDDDGRVKSKRSAGFNSQDNGDHAKNGLVRVYEYGTTGELSAEAVQKGEDGTQKYYVAKYKREVAGRPELITEKITFPEPSTSDSDGLVEKTVYTFSDPPSGGTPCPECVGHERDAISKKVVSSPPAQVSVNDPAPYYPTSVAWYDAGGNETWSGAGLLSGDAGTGTAKVFFLDRRTFNDKGQVVEQVADTDQAHDNRTRTAASPALNLTSTYEYDPVFGLKKIVQPNGRETRICYQLPVGDDPSITQWVFTDLVLRSGQYVALSPAQRNLIVGSVVVESRKLKVLSVTFPDEGEGPFPEPATELISTSIPEYNSDGQMTGMAVVATGARVSANVGYDSAGRLGKNLAPDGTITRYGYDGMGRIERVYRGTNDDHEVWGSAPLCGNPPTAGCYNPTNDPTPPTAYPDNLVLIEKRSYGTGVNDAGRLKTVRHYRDKVNNQYFEVDAAGQPVGGANDENDVGWATNHAYDWRMREVWVQKTSFGTPASGNTLAVQGSAIGHTLTWYDNLDRVRLVAEYADAVPAIADSLKLADAPSPTQAYIKDLLDPLTTPKPLSLTETLYNPNGQVQETRTYTGLNSLGQPQYTAQVTYYDHAGRPIEVHSPQSPVQHYEYDAKGRQILSWTTAGTATLTRTETAFDDDDRPFKTVNYERRHDATTDELSGASFVRTYTYTWYDPAGKVIATADFGTNNGDYSTGDEPPARAGLSAPVEPTNAEISGASVTDLKTAGLPAGTLVTAYAYDAAGHQAAVFHPDGTVTRNEYDGLGRLILLRENAGKLGGQPQRITAYFYECAGNTSESCQGSRLLKIAAVLPTHKNGDVAQWADIDWSAAGAVGTPATLQVTSFDYASQVVDSSQAAISGNNSWISAVHYPDPVTGQPSTEASLTFTYYSDGSVASRMDAKGNWFKYFYDALGRNTRTEFESQSALASGGTPISGSIDYEYTADGKLRLVRLLSGNNVISENTFEYDNRGNLQAEHQDHRKQVEGWTPPVVQYARNTQTAQFAEVTDPRIAELSALIRAMLGRAITDGGNDRLTGITYPARSEGGTARQLTFGYGSGVDDVLCRVASITDGDTNFGTLATYAYAGTSRRVSSSLGSAVTQTVDEAGAYTGLDRFGRIKDLHFKYGPDGLTPDTTVHRYEYAYDLSGNRTAAKAVLATINGGGHNNDRSWVYNYDAIQRLMSAHMGTVVGTTPSIDTDAGVPRRLQTWVLDNLGNWSGTPAGTPSFTRQKDDDGNGTFDAVDSIRHQVDASNQVTSVTTNGTSQKYVYDRAGNLVFDGQLVYQYDAWNRLTEVDAAGGLTYTGNAETDDFNTAGQIAPTPSTDALGAVKYRFYYDGLGRLMATEYFTPDPTPSTRTEDYYYDGVRRIQETTHLGPRTQQVASTDITTTREYVYGPNYVDEFVAQIAHPAATGTGSAGPQLLYMLQDANYNVVGILGKRTDPNDPNRTYFDVLAQYTYEPYGTRAAADFAQDGTFRFLSIANGNENTVGHQGLFFYPTSNNGSALDAGTPGLYYNRDRWYSPQLGRFVGREMNESGAPVLASLAHDGHGMSLGAHSFRAVGHFADGMHLFAYTASNPVNGTDPSGRMTLGELGLTVATEAYLNASIPGSTVAGMWAVRGLFAGIAAYNAYLLATDPEYLSHFGNDVVMFGTMPGMSAMADDMGYIASLARSMRRSAGGTLEVGESFGAAAARNAGISVRRLQHFFTSGHAPDFGVTSNWNPAAGEALEASIRAFIQRATPIAGWFRSYPTGTYYYQQSTRLFIFVDDSNTVIAGWKASEEQIMSLLTNGYIW